MCRRALYLLALISSGTAYHLAPRVEQSLDIRAAYQGAWPFYQAGSCPQTYSTPCGAKDDVNQICCPTGNTCHGTFVHCCPTAQDCSSFVTNFPTCVDPASNMFAYGNGYFCCAQGQTGVYPSSGPPFCQSNDVAVPVSIQATMISQFGGTSVTPFGGYGTVAPSATGSGAGTSAGRATITSSTVRPTTTTSSNPAPSSAASNSSGFSFSIPAYIALGVGAVFLLVFVYGIYKCCTRRMPAKAGPSVLSGYGNQSGYVPAPSQQIPYYPPPYQPGYQTTYDPVMERGTIQTGMTNSPAPTPEQISTIVSPMTPPQHAWTPLPEYRFKDELERRTGSPPSGGASAMTPVEMMALDDASRGRAEMPVADAAHGRAELG